MEFLVRRTMLPEALQPYAKAVYPFVLAIIATLGQWVLTGEFNTAEAVTIGTGASAALLTLLVPNGAALHFHEGEPPEGDTTTLGTPVVHPELLAGRGGEDETAAETRERQAVEAVELTVEGDTREIFLTTSEEPVEQYLEPEEVMGPPQSSPSDVGTGR
jgi:hypothetical protein